MQNEPNFKNGKMNTTNVLAGAYENKSDWTLGQNEPKQTQFVVSLPALSLSNGSNLFLTASVQKRVIMMPENKFLAVVTGLQDNNRQNLSRTTMRGRDDRAKCDV